MVLPPLKHIRGLPDRDFLTIGIRKNYIVRLRGRSKVDRFRRDEALARTAEIRPDLIAALDCKALDKADRKTLMALGWEVSAAHPRRLAD